MFVPCPLPPKTRPVSPPTPEEIPDLPLKGRGAVSNRPGRYEPGDRPRESDGWDWQDEEDAPKLRTTVTVDKTKSIIARNQSPDIAFDQSINAYRGCEHGCIYCFARPTHAFLGHSPGLDFESRLYMKPEAAKLLDAELRKPGYKPKVIAMGTNNRSLSANRAALPDHAAGAGSAEPLQPSGRYHHQIRQCAARCRQPLGDMAKRNLIKVYISVTTLDRDLARTMEPRALDPGIAAEGDRRAACGRHPGRRLGGADHSGPDRHGDREHHRARGGGGRRECQLHPCSACRSRSKTCSSNGWRRMRR